MNRKKSRNHHNKEREFVVIGLGRFGASLATALAQKGYTVIGIDRNPTLVQRLADELTQTLNLDATDDIALQEAGIQNFDTVVVAIGSDFESNILATVALKSLGVRWVVCKALTFRQKTILQQIGADQVVLPEIEAGQRLAQDLVQPTVISQLRLNEDVGVAERLIPPPLFGLTLQQADLRKRFGVTIVAIHRGEEHIFSPPATIQMKEGDVIVLIGSNTDIARFSEAY